MFADEGSRNGADDFIRYDMLVLGLVAKGHFVLENLKSRTSLKFITECSEAYQESLKLGFFRYKESFLPFIGKCVLTLLKKSCRIIQSI